MTKEEIEEEVLNDYLGFLKEGTTTIKSVKDVISGIINLHLSEQKEKHDKEMEGFAEWIDLNRWIFSTEDLWYQNSDGNPNEGITTTELLTKFKNR